MDDADKLAQDRRRYHLHAATFIVGFLGLLGTPGIFAILEARVAIWFVVGFSVILSISGLLAIAVERTLFSKRAEDTEGFDLEGYPGDAIETPGLWSGDYAAFSNAVAPYGVLGMGLLCLLGALIWALG